jgi:NTP pyrophosphatase (non-canonical NTP hydrolase)
MDNFLQRLRESNLQRTIYFKHAPDAWSPAQYACALAGEVGELCNLIKKEFRGTDVVDPQDIKDEIADVAIYLDLLAARYGISLEDAIREKWNAKSEQVGCPIRI